MPNHVHLLTAAVLLSMGLVATPATARDSDKPWTPKKFSNSELIDFGTFERSPVKLPWKIERTEQVSSHGNLNFKHTLDAPYSEVNSHFDQAYEDEKPALKLKPFATPKGASSDLFIYGLGKQDDIRRVTLGNSDLRRKFTIELTREDGETVLIFKNIAYSMVFGAGVPRRAPFRPVDTDPVSM